MCRLLAVVWLAATAVSAATSNITEDAGSTPPNIIFIVADDLGWNDVGFHGSDQFQTPNIDALAFHGVILNSHYVQPLCTPSRAALMTGRYPIRTGMQGHVIYGTEPRALPEGKILPQYLRELGYVTRAVGKWHLGHHAKNYTPTYRGFDSHFGYWNGWVGYNDFIFETDGLHGYDLRDNLTTAWQHSGRYVTDVFTAEAERIIGQHDTQKPLFLYFAHLACHAGDRAKLLDAPQHVIDRFSYIADPGRRLLAAVIWKMDESVGRVVAALQRRDMLANSIIVFISDNGGHQSENWGSNYPLRGMKGSLWEGGVRCPALVWSPLLHTAPRVSNQLMHVSDWLPTLYAAAGGNASALPADMDGVDMWPELVVGGLNPRTELLVNVDEQAGNAAVRVGEWKLVRGVQSNDGYAGASGREDGGRTPAYLPQQVLSSAAGKAVSMVTGGSTTAEDILRLRAEATVSCPERPQQPRCAVLKSTDLCVFNLLEDPCEARAGSAPEGVLSRLLERLDALSRPLEPQVYPPAEPELADPRRWNNTWVPWSDCAVDEADEACNVVVGQ